MPLTQPIHPSSRRRVAPPACAFALSIAAAAAAAQPADAGPPAASWSLGLGVVSMQKPYAGIDREDKLLPVLRFENQYLRVFGPQVAVKLPSVGLGGAQRLDFSLVGKYDGSGYEADDAPILGGMQERKAGFWAGAEAQWKNDVADVKATWLADASGHSKGQKFSLGLERTWRLGGKVMLTPRVEATWHDKKYVDYYYGVRDTEARLGRAAYAGKAGTGAEAGLRGVYLFDQRHSVFMDVAVSSLPRQVKDSPLVDRSTENRVLLGYTYRFR